MRSIKVTTLEPEVIQDTPGHRYHECDSQTIYDIAGSMASRGFNPMTPVIVECYLKDVDDPDMTNFLAVVSGRHRIMAALEASTSVYAVVLGYDVMCAIEKATGDVDAIQSAVYGLLRSGADLTPEAIVEAIG